VSLFSAVSETFHKKNVNNEIEEGLTESKRLVQRIHQNKKKSRLYLSTVFGCPYEGSIQMAAIETVLKKAIETGVDEVALSDTIGVAHPNQIKEVLEMALKHLPTNKIALHFHNTYGIGIANVAAAIEMGVNQFDGATGGLGGCPYAKGASGNLATEEIVYFLEREGRAPKVDWSSISETLKELKQCGLHTESHIASVLEKGGNLYGIK
jgi:hydroxymethylglutaryl-CoA lyase